MNTAIVPVQRLPKSIKEHKFCARWQVHYDHILAAREAGYSEPYIKRGEAKKMFARLREHLLGLKAKKEAAVAKEVALEQRDILREMKAIAFASPQDYVKEVQVDVKADDGTVSKVKRLVRKGILELTHDQAAAISKVTFHPDGSCTYDLPDEKSKHPYLKDLGQHLGLFHPKLIQEHRHEHRHRALSFRDVDTAKLAEAEKMFMEALGSEGRRMLGEPVVDADFEDVTP